MKRREAIKTLTLVSAGLALLPACMGNDKAIYPLKNFSITSAQENLLIALTQSIIPKTSNFIGAGDLRSHEFVLKMLDDCTSPEDQQKFVTGMKAFETAFEKKIKHPFSKSDAAQQLEWLQLVTKKEGIVPEASDFLATVKRYTIQSFTTSKAYMTQVLDYKIIPGSNFKGCVPAKKS